MSLNIFRFSHLKIFKKHVFLLKSFIPKGLPLQKPFVFNGVKD